MIRRSKPPTICSGKKVQVSTVGSTTDWLVKKLADVKGWGPDGITTVALGGELSAQLAALRTHQVDAIVGTSSVAFQLEEKKEGRLLIPTSAYVKDFLLHAIFATNTLLAERSGCGARLPQRLVPVGRASCAPTAKRR